MTIQERGAVLSGGPHTGYIFIEFPGANSLVWPASPNAGESVATPHEEDITYHRTDRTDAAGRVVYEYRG